MLLSQHTTKSRSHDFPINYARYIEQLVDKPKSTHQQAFKKLSNDYFLVLARSGRSQKKLKLLRTIQAVSVKVNERK